MGYSNNEKKENNGFSYSYNLMLKNIPHHIKGGLKRTTIILALTHIEITPPPPGTLNNIQTALQENIGYTCCKIILPKHMLKFGFTYKKSQTNWKLLIEATSSSAESNIYGRFVITNDVRPNIRLRLQLLYRHRQRNRGLVNLLYGNLRLRL